MGVRIKGDPQVVGRLEQLLGDDRAGAPEAWLDVHATSGAPPESGRAALSQPMVEISLDDMDRAVLRADGAGARVGDRVELLAAPSVDVRTLKAVLDATWPLVLPRHGLIHVHGAAVRDPNGTGWLLAGDAGAGKSTTAITLALAGWGWTSDDATYISISDSQVAAHGWREQPRLSARSAAALRLSREDHASPYKTAVALPPHVLAARADSMRVDRLLLPEIAGSTRVERLSAPQALNGLLRASAWLVCLPRLADSYMRILATVAELPAWRLLLGPELLEHPELTPRVLLERCTL